MNKPLKPSREQIKIELFDALGKEFRSLNRNQIQQLVRMLIESYELEIQDLLIEAARIRSEDATL